MSISDWSSDVCSSELQSPSLLRPRDTPGLIDACAEAGVFDEDFANALREAHGVLLAAGLECTLARRRRWVVENEAAAGARIDVRAAFRPAVLAFHERPAAPTGSAGDGFPAGQPSSPIESAVSE